MTWQNRIWACGPLRTDWLGSERLASLAILGYRVTMKADRRLSIEASLRCRSFPVMIFISGLLSYLPCCGHASEQLPGAAEVTQRMIERSRAVAAAARGPHYVYEKSSLFEHLDATGRSL